ncbi:MAG: DNA polymerase III subunit alpha [Firmicutes bacterium]|nr:DNA polymerase III subunit alpha [Bacillota bacterium]MDD4263041.1 DNA polymerase III subunit alpha [Bacillota bacterium]MDD4692810.1 DNA polymerase III subunit alpha [Bacillota bacterium]
MFVHTHVHTDGSLQDGLSTVEEIIKKAAEDGQPAVAITDHGNMFRETKAHKLGKKYGVKIISGCELYLSRGKKGEKTPKPYHLIALAKNDQGYQNLIRLVSLGQRQFYYRPQIYWEDLEEFHEGIIFQSACLGGAESQLILAGFRDEAKAEALRRDELFGRGNYYLELQNHGMAEQLVVNRELIEISKATGIPLVATNDSHYTEQNQAELHRVLLCLQWGITLDEYSERAEEAFSNEHYFKTAEQMRLLFADVPEAIENTLVIAEKCEFEMKFGELHLPEFPISGGNLHDYFKRQVALGLDFRYGKTPSPDVLERTQYEMKVIEQMGYESYFLIVSDFINWAKQNDIPVGPGRGSAAGSIVAYLLGITEIDPLVHDLLFERFLNPDRIGMPDIDVDICQRRRQDVINYVKDKYGEDHVGQIVTFGTFGARGVVRDIVRVLGLPYSLGDKIAKSIPTTLGMTIDKALEGELGQLCNQDPEINRVVVYAKGLEGNARHASLHAAGIVITPKPIYEYVPMYRAAEDTYAVQTDMDATEERGLLKMDFLGLRNLTIIDDTIKTLPRKLDLASLKLDDPATYQLLQEGDTLGVFQLESDGMRNLCRRIRPTEFEDITALIALYRPGPLESGMVDDFIACKHGEKEAHYLHEKLIPILKPTYGVWVYQEQLMSASIILAGYTRGESDELRKAVAKKKKDLMDKHREMFISGAKEKGLITEEEATQLWDEVFVGFGSYCFNKAHSAAYALIAYQTAYLKAHYPVEFMTALLNSVIDNSDKTTAYLEYIKKQLMINVLNIDINHSEAYHTALEGNIRLGLGVTKGVGIGLASQIAENRQTESYQDILDLCTKNKDSLDSRALENLIKAGALDEFGPRESLLEVSKLALDRAKKDNANQLSLFEPEDVSLELPIMPKKGLKEYLDYEKEALGFYLSGHPLDAYADVLKKYRLDSIKDLPERSDGSEVVLAGIITKVNLYSDRKGQTMAFIDVEDFLGSVSITVFSDIYSKFRPETGEVYFIKGVLQFSNFGEKEEIKVVAKKLLPIDDRNQEKTSRA